MKLEFSIRSSEPIEINQNENALARGITIKRRMILMESLDAPIFYIAYIGKEIALPVAATIIANYLWEKLRGAKDSQLTISNQSVEINAQNIETLIIIQINKDTNQEH